MTLKTLLELNIKKCSQRIIIKNKAFDNTVVFKGHACDVPTDIYDEEVQRFRIKTDGTLIVFVCIFDDIYYI